MSNPMRPGSPPPRAGGFRPTANSFERRADSKRKSSQLSMRPNMRPSDFHRHEKNGNIRLPPGRPRVDRPEQLRYTGSSGDDFQHQEVGGWPQDDKPDARQRSHFPQRGHSQTNPMNSNELKKMAYFQEVQKEGDIVVCIEHCHS